MLCSSRSGVTRRLGRIVEAHSMSPSSRLWTFSHFTRRTSAKGSFASSGNLVEESAASASHRAAFHPHWLDGDQLASWAAWLRDSCICPRCVDPSTTQKLFQTSDIPSEIRIANSEAQPGDQVRITWENDVHGYDGRHKSTYPKAFLENSIRATPAKGLHGLDGVGKADIEIETWDKAQISGAFKFIDYEDYMTSDDVMYDILVHMRSHGLAIIRGIPDQSDAVESIVGRIGHLRDTFYGHTWNVKSVSRAKNVAYTSQYLGFHMDLLYMSEPPGLQFLHCLRNSCAGGASMFSDAFHAARSLGTEYPADWDILRRYAVPYHYHNAGEHYYQTHPIIQTSSADPSTRPDFINWSPPFQAPFNPAILRRKDSNSNSNCHEPLPDFADFLRAAKRFQHHVEAPGNIYEHRLQAGECVLFNNRRVLHARRAFDTTAGERWLKGAYLDTDVFLSRLRVLHTERSK